MRAGGGGAKRAPAPASRTAPSGPPPHLTAPPPPSPAGLVEGSAAWHAELRDLRAIDELEAFESALVARGVKRDTPQWDMEMHFYEANLEDRARVS